MTRPIARTPEPGDIVRTPGGTTWRVDQATWTPNGDNRSHLTITLDRWVDPGAPLLALRDPGDGINREPARSLADELRKVADALQHTINASITEAERQGIDPYAMVTPAGAPYIAPQLAALAQVLAALRVTS